MDNYKVDDIPSLSLAFLGDSIYAVKVREYLIINEPYLKPDQLHKKANTLVSAKAQSNALLYLRRENLLEEWEWDVARKARNKSSQTRAKNATIQEYRNSSGLEALIGYLSLAGEMARIEALMTIIIGLGRVNE
ncbi:Mini-ribonuclease 3 [Jeotgalicoccus meleagridis]|uniref:Mini-ribonuclease 3 n=1 Tax=Jeotgalicoccus meleagridis TaxID=2759181 RepID=A0A6V7RA88_9STAP|nr:ribonuclease III domain-containing protein [Jeotgalicoccus meleagridis]CAD2074405.1 Mini-ribonuclease 3 [Jeotgalicoccus meleagridis]